MAQVGEFQEAGAWGDEILYRVARAGLVHG